MHDHISLYDEIHIASVTVITSCVLCALIFIFYPTEAEQSDEQLYQEITKVWLILVFLITQFSLIVLFFHLPSIFSLRHRPMLYASYIQ